MHSVNTILIGRLLLGLIFVMAGMNKIRGFEGTQPYVASQGMPMTSLLLLGTIVVEALGEGLSVITGYKARWGAAVLFAFLIPATLIFHTNLGDQTPMLMFLKNLSIMGGLLLVITHGAGPLSLTRSTDAAYQQATA